MEYRLHGKDAANYSMQSSQPLPVPETLQRLPLYVLEQLRDLVSEGVALDAQRVSAEPIENPLPQEMISILFQHSQGEEICWDELEACCHNLSRADWQSALDSEIVLRRQKIQTFLAGLKDWVHAQGISPEEVAARLALAEGWKAQPDLLAGSALSFTDPISSIPSNLRELTWVDTITLGPAILAIDLTHFPAATRHLSVHGNRLEWCNTRLSPEHPWLESLTFTSDVVEIDGSTVPEHITKHLILKGPKEGLYTLSHLHLDSLTWEDITEHDLEQLPDGQEIHTLRIKMRPDASGHLNDFLFKEILASQCFTQVDLELSQFVGLPEGVVECPRLNRLSVRDYAPHLAPFLLSLLRQHVLLEGIDEETLLRQAFLQELNAWEQADGLSLDEQQARRACAAQWRAAADVLELTSIQLGPAITALPGALLALPHLEVLDIEGPIQSLPAWLSRCPSLRSVTIEQPPSLKDDITRQQITTLAARGVPLHGPYEAAMQVDGIAISKDVKSQLRAAGLWSDFEYNAVKIEHEVPEVLQAMDNLRSLQIATSDAPLPLWMGELHLRAIQFESPEAAAYVSDQLLRMWTVNKVKILGIPHSRLEAIRHELFCHRLQGWEHSQSITAVEQAARHNLANLLRGAWPHVETIVIPAPITAIPECIALCDELKRITLNESCVHCPPEIAELTALQQVVVHTEDGEGWLQGDFARELLKRKIDIEGLSADQVQHRTYELFVSELEAWASQNPTARRDLADQLLAEWPQIDRVSISLPPLAPGVLPQWLCFLPALQHVTIEHDHAVRQATDASKRGWGEQQVCFVLQQWLERGVKLDGAWLNLETSKLYLDDLQAWAYEPGISQEETSERIRLFDHIEYSCQQQQENIYITVDEPISYIPQCLAHLPVKVQMCLNASVQEIPTWIGAWTNLEAIELKGLKRGMERLQALPALQRVELRDSAPLQVADLGVLLPRTSLKISVVEDHWPAELRDLQEIRFDRPAFEAALANEATAEFLLSMVAHRKPKIYDHTGQQLSARLWEISTLLKSTIGRIGARWAAEEGIAADERAAREALMASGIKDQGRLKLDPPISSVPKFVSMMPYLDELILGAAVQEFPEWLDELSNLRAISIAHPTCDHLPKLPPNLRRLSLDLPALSSLPTELINLSALKELTLEHTIADATSVHEVLVPLLERGCTLMLAQYRYDKDISAKYVYDKVLPEILRVWVGDAGEDASELERRSVLAERFLQWRDSKYGASLDLTDLPEDPWPTSWFRSSSYMISDLQSLSVDNKHFERLFQEFPQIASTVTQLTVTGATTKLPPRLWYYHELQTLNIQLHLDHTAISEASIEELLSDELLKYLLKRNVAVRASGFGHLGACVYAELAVVEIGKDRQWCSFLGLSVPSNFEKELYLAMSDVSDPVFGMMAFVEAQSQDAWKKCKDLMLTSGLGGETEALAKQLLALNRQDAVARLERHLKTYAGEPQPWLRMVLKLLDLPPNQENRILAETLVDQLHANKRGLPLRIPQDNHLRMCELTGTGVALRLRTIATSLQRVLAPPAGPFVPKELITCLSQEPAIADLYSMSARVSEGYTVGAHTEMVLTQFEGEHPKYAHELEQVAHRARLLGIADGDFDPISFMRFLLAVHDIGKGLGRSSAEQHLYTLPIALAISKALGYSDEEIQLIHELLDHDLLGEWQKALHMQKMPRLDLELVVSAMEGRGLSSRLPTQDFVLLQYLFYISDASSYPSIQKLMKKDKEDRLIFSTDLEAAQGAKMLVSTVQVRQGLEGEHADLYLRWEAELQQALTELGGDPTVIELVETDSSLWDSCKQRCGSLPDRFDWALLIQRLAHLKALEPVQQLALDACRMLEDGFRLNYVDSVTRWRAVLRDISSFQALQQNRPELSQANDYMSSILDDLKNIFHRGYGVDFEGLCYRFYAPDDRAKILTFRKLAALASDRPLGSYAWFLGKEQGTQLAETGHAAVLQSMGVQEHIAMEGFALLHALTIEVLQHTKWPARLHAQTLDPSTLTVIRIEQADVLQQLYGAETTADIERMASMPHTALDCGNYEGLADSKSTEITVYRVPIHRIVGGIFLNRKYGHTFGNPRHGGALTFISRGLPSLYVGTYEKNEAWVIKVDTLPNIEQAGSTAVYVVESVDDDVDPLFEDRAHIARAWGLTLGYQLRNTDSGRRWHPICLANAQKRS